MCEDVSPALVETNRTHFCLVSDTIEVSSIHVRRKSLSKKTGKLLRQTPDLLLMQ